MSRNARARAIEWTSASLPARAGTSAAIAGRTIQAKAGSPTQPRPREASVTPSWVAER